QIVDAVSAGAEIFGGLRDRQVRAWRWVRFGLAVGETLKNSIGNEVDELVEQLGRDVDAEGRTHRRPLRRPRRRWCRGLRKECHSGSRAVRLMLHLLDWRRHASG